jgi:hypothetical protein
MSGRKHSEETKQILSYVNKGKTLSEETKQKMSDIKQGEKNPMFNQKKNLKDLEFPLKQ